MKKILTKKDITGVDIELSNVCNLKCPICLSQFKQFKDMLKPHFIDIDYLISILDSYINLKLVSLAGDASEPTLYPSLLKLLNYLKNRDSVFVELYTNASTHDEQWWTDLNKYFSKNSKVFFTICGSTPKMHAKYRVGSDLDTVIKHALAFKKDNPNKNDYMQYIKFEYNKNDNPERIEKILSQFSNSGILHTDPIWERFHLNETDNNNGICSEKLFSFLYKRKSKEILNSKDRNITCYSYNNKYIRIDNNGVVSPCVCYRINKDESFEKDGILDYTEIYENKCPFCYECDYRMQEFLDDYDRDAFYMC